MTEPLHAVLQIYRGKTLMLNLVGHVSLHGGILWRAQLDGSLVSGRDLIDRIEVKFSGGRIDENHN